MISISGRLCVNYIISLLASSLCTAARSPKKAGGCTQATSIPPTAPSQVCTISSSFIYTCVVTSYH